VDGTMIKAVDEVERKELEQGTADSEQAGFPGGQGSEDGGRDSGVVGERVWGRVKIRLNFCLIFTGHICIY